jgi:hypothetical protein
LKRLGHTVEILNPYQEFNNELSNFLKSKIHYRTGYLFLQKNIEKWLRIKLVKFQDGLDLIWIDSGELFGSNCIKIIKLLNKPILLYNIDDPTGERDGYRFRSLIKALPFYNLVVVVRKESKEECLKLGAKNVIQVNRSYDEHEHKAFDKNSEIPINFISDVSFIGTWMRYENRDEFILKLIFILIINHEIFFLLVFYLLLIILQIILVQLAIILNNLLHLLFLAAM